MDLMIYGSMNLTIPQPSPFTFTLNRRCKYTHVMCAPLMYICTGLLYVLEIDIERGGDEINIKTRNARAETTESWGGLGEVGGGACSCYRPKFIKLNVTITSGHCVVRRVSMYLTKRRITKRCMAPVGFVAARIRASERTGGRAGCCVKQFDTSVGE